MQEAVAIGLEKATEHKFFEEQVAAYQERRDVLCSYFDQIGLSYTKPEGSYFLLVDISPVKVPEGFPIVETCKGRGKDFEFCWWLCQELKVVGIPSSEVSIILFCSRRCFADVGDSSTVRSMSTLVRGLLVSLS